MKPRRSRRGRGRSQNRYLWLLLEILIVLAGGIAIALIAGNMLATEAPTESPTVTAVLPSATGTAPPTEVTATPSPPGGTTSPPAATATTSPATPGTTATQTVPPSPTLAQGDPCAEPNNDWEAAFGPVACPTSIQCRIWPEGDLADFYLVNLEVPSRLTARLTQIPAGTSANLLIFDSDRQLLISSEEPGQAEEFVEIALEPGQYYVAVRALAGVNETDPYRLDLNCVPLVTPTAPSASPVAGELCGEPNSSFDTALGPLACGQAVSCDLNPGGGDLADVYVLEFNEPTSLDIQLTDIPERSNWRLQLYSSDETVLATSDNDGNADERIVREVAPGRYYVAVLVSRTSIFAGGYVLRVDCVTEVATPTPPPPPTTPRPPATDTPRATPTPSGPPTPTPQGACAEPNDNFDLAYGPLQCGQTVACYMDPAGGDLTDMYFIDLDGPSQLVIELTDMPETVDWDLSLFDINGVLLGFSGGVLNENERIVYLADPGRYYIAVEVIESGLPAGGYLLTVSCPDLPTPTPSLTPIPTGTPSPTWTGVPTSTPSKTLTPTYTRTLTRTRTGSPTRTGTWTGTPTRTLSWTPTLTPSRTETPSWTPSPTQTPTFTPTLTPTHTGTATATGTFTLSPTWTLTLTPTGTPTITGTATETVLATSTPTGTIAISAIMGGQFVVDGAESAGNGPRALAIESPAPPGASAPQGALAWLKRLWALQSLAALLWMHL